MFRSVLALCSLALTRADRDALPVAAFKPYPGVKSAYQNTSGTVLLSFSQDSVQISYNLNHVDPRCSVPDPGKIPNSCGLHVHVGFSCSADPLVGGHYYNMQQFPVDPWKNVAYFASEQNAVGGATVHFGESLENTKGRALVIHDYDGARVACALLPATTDQVRLGHIGVYPSYLGSLNSIMGMVTLDFRATSVQLSWQLSGVDPTCAQKSDMENSCGIHIHEGTTCDLASAVGGHYYDKSLFEKDVWQSVFYASDSAGNSMGSVNVEFGYGFEQAKGRTVVIHDQSGNRISCTVLPQKASREKVALALAPFPEMTQQITGRVVADFRGEGVKLSYDLVGATGCETPGAVANPPPNSCGIHIHVGFTCDLETVMGHYYNPTLYSTDPWSFAPYLTNESSTTSTGSVMVSYGRDWDHSKGRVVVVHDAKGAKVSCAVLPATTDRAHIPSLSRLSPDTTMMGEVTLDFRATSVHIAYSLVNVEQGCSQRGSMENSCGIHIHEGTSCDSLLSVGKHFFNTMTDVWANTSYVATGTTAAGSVDVENGYDFEATKGRVVVVHNYDGAKVACGVIPSAKLRDMTGVAKFMPTSESTVEGSALLDFKGMGTKITYTLAGVDARCEAPRVGNLSCGIHIHRYFTCEDMMVGTHYFNESLYPSDPWMYAVYYAAGGSANGSIVVSYGEDFAHSAGRALVLHDYNGNKVSCATIPETTDRVSVGPLKAFVEQKPLLTTLSMDFRATSVHITYKIEGVDPRCVQPSAANNSCGLHIHTGFSCEETEVGGHFYDTTTIHEDPWLPDHIHSNEEGVAAGTLDIEFGYGYAQSKGRALVLHNQDGAKVACALIPVMATTTTASVGDWVTFPGYDGAYKGVEASLSANFKADSVSLAYSLSNVPCECAAAGPAKNSCGLHIHEGTSCSDATAVGGHYFDATKFPTDPWAVAVYSAAPCGASLDMSGTSAQGTLTVQYGYDYAATDNRVMVVHDYNGVKIACAPITPSKSPVVMIVLIVSGAVLVLAAGIFIYLRKRRKTDPNGILHQNLLANNDRTNAMRRTLSVNV